MSSRWHARIKALLGPNTEALESGIEEGARINAEQITHPHALKGEAPLSKNDFASVPTLAPDILPEPAKQKTVLSGFGEPVLIVDDDRDWCLECTFSLRQLGFEPLVANSTADALAVFVEHDVSIAIVDYHLPEGDGITLIQKLTQKADQQGRSINFIMATGYATKDIAIDAMRASVVDFLEKPITQTQLRDALQRIKGLRPSIPARDDLLERISGLGAELQRLALLMDSPQPEVRPMPSSSAVQSGGELDESRLKAFIRDQLSREAKRREIGGGELFGDPTWAMLLDLLLAKIEDRRISVSSACIASGAPMSTALRLVRRLVDEEVLCRLPDEHDRRRHFLVINPKFEKPLLDYVADQAR